MLDLRGTAANLYAHEVMTFGKKKKVQALLLSLDVTNKLPCLFYFLWYEVCSVVRQQ